METEEKVLAGASPDEVLVEKANGEQKRRRRRRTQIVIVVSLLNAGLIALLASQLLTPAADQGQSNANNSPLIGHLAPDFTLAVLSTHSAPAIHLASLVGKPVMINFWASWCDPCKHEAPLLQATWQRVQSQGVVFLGIDYEDAQNDGLTFLHTYGITYSNVVDPSGGTAINYGVTGVPETFFLDRHGVIVQKVIGELSEQTIENDLRLLSR